ncbi:hypothetical protein ACJMK2_026788 [Sinanodonta woodiana]|uniref:Major facilitator superfamily (MFS) profile domain-containing protein n=1 Tax=Sinanodonta woodiana TaxID=1069815 RepID=A0ABD3XP37_SINWO
MKEESKAETNKVAKDKNRRVPNDIVLQQPIPPDGDWGWVITFASFMVGFLVDGVAFTFGVFFKEFVNHFGQSKGATSWINSVLNGTYLTIGPLASGLVNLFGCRKVGMLGALLSAAGFFLCTFSPNIEAMIILYGFIGGMGFGFLYLPAIVMVGQYFEKRRALATGIAVCGSGLGGFVFAPLCEYLLSEYGWKGAMWIISGIILNGVVFASLFRPLESMNTITVSTDDSTCGLENDVTQNDVNLQPVKIMVWDENGVEQGVFSAGDDELKNTKEQQIYKWRSMELTEIKMQEEMARNYEIAQLCFSQDLEIQPKTRQKLRQSRELRTSPLIRKDVFYSGSIQNIPEFKNAKNKTEFVRSMTRLDSESSVIGGGRRCGVFSDLFDFSLLKSPTFVVYGVSCLLCMFGFFIPFNYIPVLAYDFGMTASEGAWLISLIGIVNTLARLLVGYVSDKSWSDPLLINNLALTIAGFSTMFVPFYSLYEILAFYCILFGSSIAAFVSLRSIIMVELLGIEKLTNSFGLVVMCQGLSSFIGSPIAGVLSDYTGNYKASFYVAGASIALAGLICFPLRRIARWEKNRNEQRSESVIVQQENYPMLEKTSRIVSGKS